MLKNEDQCIIEGCPSPGTNHLGVRLRRSDGTAIWAPNTGASVCDKHGAYGMKVGVTLELTSGHLLETEVRSNGNSITRVSPIRHKP